MSDFNSLVALSQEHKKPVFDLTDAELRQTGIVLERTQKSMTQFKEVYAEGADRIISIIGNG